MKIIQWASGKGCNIVMPRKEAYILAKNLLASLNYHDRSPEDKIEIVFMTELSIEQEK